MGLATSYTSRERARYGMLDAMGADGATLAAQLNVILGTLNDSIAEAQAQLDAAKLNGLPQAEINALAESLFGLRTEAAETAEELERLAKVPLEEAARHWNDALSVTQALMDLLGNHSDASLADALFPQMMGEMGAGYESSMDLMRASSDPEDIASYAMDALSALSDMFSAEKAQLDKELDRVLDVIDTNEKDWKDAWEDRGDILEEEHERELEALDAQAEAVRSKYDEEIEALRAQADALQEQWDEMDRAASERKLRQELANLEAQGYYTEEDVRRMKDLRDQIRAEQEQSARDSQLEAIYNRIESLETDRDAELARLDVLREALANRYAIIVDAHNAEAAEAEANFEAQRTAAETQHQQLLDDLVEDYQDRYNAVIEERRKIEGESGQWYSSGYQLGRDLAQGLSDAIPLIQSAADDVAKILEDMLELNSPAKMGPLSKIDRWWEPMPDMLLAPLVNSDLIRPLSEMLTLPDLADQRVSIDVNITGDTANQAALPELARLVAEQIDTRVANARVGWGGRR
jgi:hypothetical protein